MSPFCQSGARPRFQRQNVTSAGSKELPNGLTRTRSRSGGGSWSYTPGQAWKSSGPVAKACGLIGDSWSKPRTMCLSGPKRKWQVLPAKSCHPAAAPAVAQSNPNRTSGCSSYNRQTTAIPRTTSCRSPGVRNPTISGMGCSRNDRSPDNPHLLPEYRVGGERDGAFGDGKGVGNLDQ